MGVIEPVAGQVQRITRIIFVEDIFAPQADAVAIVGKSIAELAVDQRISLLRGAFRVEQVEILLGRETAVHAPAQLSARSEEHTSALQSLMRISYAVFCLKKKTTISTKLTQI